VYFEFKNKNQYDLRRCNVEIYHWYHKNIIEKYEVIEYINGHYLTIGQDANIMKNPIWRVKENDKEYLLDNNLKNDVIKVRDNFKKENIIFYDYYARDLFCSYSYIDECLKPALSTLLERKKVVNFEIYQLLLFRLPVSLCLTTCLSMSDYLSLYA
jgi:hypothetical protein